MMVLALPLATCQPQERLPELCRSVKVLHVYTDLLELAYWSLAIIRVTHVFYSSIGFDGPMCPDHAMHIDSDTEWGNQYWAWATGHMRGLDQALGMAER